MDAILLALGEAGAAGGGGRARGHAGQERRAPPTPIWTRVSRGHPGFCGAAQPLTPPGGSRGKDPGLRSRQPLLAHGDAPQTPQGFLMDFVRRRSLPTLG